MIVKNLLQLHHLQNYYLKKKTIFVTITIILGLLGRFQFFFM